MIWGVTEHNGYHCSLWPIVQKAWTDFKSPRFLNLEGYPIYWGDCIRCENFDISNVSANIRRFEKLLYLGYLWSRSPCGILNIHAIGWYLVFWQDMSGFENPQISRFSGTYMQFPQIAYFIWISKLISAFQHECSGMTSPFLRKSKFIKSADVFFNRIIRMFGCIRNDYENRGN